MPLPRFARVPESRRRQILGVARDGLAADMPYNQSIDASGISEANAYLHFDGEGFPAATSVMRATDRWNLDCLTRNGPAAPESMYQLRQRMWLA